jgi:hypothetical protein
MVSAAGLEPLERKLVNEVGGLGDIDPFGLHRVPQVFPQTVAQTRTPRHTGARSFNLFDRNDDRLGVLPVIVPKDHAVVVPLRVLCEPSPHER